ncbi:MAG: SAM-dependent methyltransferase [Proteobacteria bacterium]|nr:MAG: SAM-dependent methyltransferase [Pseudomonadota bacterium]
MDDPQSPQFTDDSQAGLKTIIAGDAITWLKNAPANGEKQTYFASLPDYSEFSTWTLEAWKTWFTETASLIFSRTAHDGLTIFFQSDIKVDDRWVDKAYLIGKAAESENHPLLFHKIYCRAPAGQTTYGRPGYSHLLVFSRGVRIKADESTADVISHLGDKSWARGMGFNACVHVADLVQKHAAGHRLVNPFCGQGGLLAVAAEKGIESLGIEKSSKRAEQARRMRADLKRAEFDLGNEIPS